MADILRPYQTAAIEAIFNAVDDGYKRLLYTLPTGCGKTTVIADLVHKLREWNGYRILILAHREELITNIADRIMSYCGYDAFEVGIEMAAQHAASRHGIVVGSVQTVRNKSRLVDQKFDCIIVDEAHHATANSYAQIAARFGVMEGECLYIGCTATPKRTDRLSIYAEKSDGTPLILWDKKKAKAADLNTTTFQKLVYEYPITNAIDDGWLVPMMGHRVETGVDIGHVSVKNGGDFSDGELQKAVDNAIRTNIAINAWKEVAGGRKTIVFCAGVEHAYHSAELWKQAGFTAEALDGSVDTAERHSTLRAFKQGDVQVLCNCALFTEGVDIPDIACVVMLRPTKSWSLYVQMAGRGARPLQGIVDPHPTADARREAIKASPKADCILLDLVDICGKHDLCTAPAILDLPANLDLEGHSVSETKAMMDALDSDLLTAEINKNPPVNYSDFKALVERVELLKTAPTRYHDLWKSDFEGYHFTKVPVGYRATLKEAAGGCFDLEVKYRDQVIATKQGVTPVEESALKSYMAHAQEHIANAIETHQADTPKATLMKLTNKQVFILMKRGHSANEINCMTTGYAKTLIAKYSAEYRASLNNEASA